MSKELMHVGDQIDFKSKTFEVVSVSAQDDGEGNLVNYKYELQLASEVKSLAIAERKSAKAEQELSDQRTVKKHRLVEAEVVTQEQADNMNDPQLDAAIEQLNAAEKEKAEAEKAQNAAPKA